MRASDVYLRFGWGQAFFLEPSRCEKSDKLTNSKKNDATGGRRGGEQINAIEQTHKYMYLFIYDR